MKTSAWQKIALVFLGLILSLVILEAGMRLGGFILTSMQAYENFRSIEQTGAYRILCLGESTTAGQYPRPLERILNRRHIGVQFSVIDKGKSTLNTLAILSRVEPYLDEYHPNMVVAMMGINDRGRHIPFEAATASKGALFIRSLRIYKLARLLLLHIVTKAKEMGFLKPAGDRQGSVKVQTPLSKTVLKETSAEAIFTEDNPKNDEGSLGARGSSQHGDNLFEPPRVQEKSPLRLGQLYLAQGELSRAEASFRRAIELDPKNDDAYVELARIYQIQGNYTAAEDSFQKAIELNPKSDHAYVGLGDFYKEQGKSLQAENSFRKAIEINPENDKAYVELGQFYLNQDKFSQAEDFFKKAIEINPKNTQAYVRLGELYRCQSKLSQAKDIFKKGIELNPRDDRILGAMVSLCEEVGKPELAKDYAEMAKQWGHEDNAAITVHNYRKLKEILDRKGVKLVCVQYPMRNVELLKKIFENDTGVIFVDNEQAFKEAVKKASYKEYFRDMFAGDFGHCTQKGNELLAQNIAEVILREVFNR